MKLNILYILNRHKINKKGLCPINCRLTLSKSKKHFATGIFINPNFWNSKKQLIQPLEQDAGLLSTQLSLISVSVPQSYLELYTRFQVTDDASLIYSKRS